MRLSSALLGLALEAAPDAGAAAATVVDHVAREQRLLPAVYLARGGRLRCAALRGYWQARDGLPGRAGIMGRTYRSGIEIVVDDVSASEDYLESNPGVVAEACFPLQRGGPHHRRPQHRVPRGAARRRPRAPTRVRPRPGRAHRRARRPAQRVGDAAPAAPRRRDGRPAGRVRRGRRAAERRTRPRPAGLRAARAHDRRRRACGRSAAVGPLADVLRAAPLESIAAWVEDGISLFTVGQPDAPPAANLADLRAAGVETLVAVGLFAHGELLGALVLASDEPAVIGTDDVELLEQLANHGAACLRTAELMGSLRERAETDPLTGLGHHATFHEALAGSHRRPTTAVVVCDIDGFKLLNDTYGHGHGDRVLCGLADAMSGALRRGDRLFRVGGDEFAALLAVDSSEQALGAAMRLREAVLEARLGRHHLGRRRGPAGGRDRRRAAGPRRPRALLGQGGRPRRRRAGQRRAAALHARPRLSRPGRARPRPGGRGERPPDAYPGSPHAWQIRHTSATSRSSPTSTMGSRRWPTASSRSPTRSIRARCASRCSTPWTSSASAASRSRPRPSASSTRRATARPTSCSSSTPRATSTSPTRSRAAWRRARARCWSSTRRRASRPRRWPTPTWPSTRGSS